LQVLRDRDREADPVLSTVEIAERLGTTRQTVGKRLDELKDEDRVASASYGQMSVWWPADELMRNRPDEDTLEVDRRELETDSRIIWLLERANVVALTIWFISSVALSTFVLGATDIGPEIPNAVAGIGILGVPIGTFGTILFTGAYYWFRSDLHKTIMRSVTDDGDANDEAPDTEEPTTA